MLRRLGIGANQSEHPVRVLRATGPDFLTVNDELITVEYCLGLQTCKVGAGTGLRIPLTPLGFAGNDFRDMSLALFVGTHFQDGRSDHRQTHAGGGRQCLNASHFFRKHFLMGRIQATTAVFGRPRRGSPAASQGAVAPFDCSVGAIELIGILKVNGAQSHFLGAVGFQPVSGFFAERV